MDFSLANIITTSKLLKIIASARATTKKLKNPAADMLHSEHWFSGTLAHNTGAALEQNAGNPKNARSNTEELVELWGPKKFGTYDAMEAFEVKLLFPKTSANVAVLGLDGVTLTRLTINPPMDGIFGVACGGGDRVDDVTVVELAKGKCVVEVG